ncbi:hypothetical protein CALCODRAFT_493252 [Calocera cornea HHB12733]|uniref:Uncharacterized protein n=1 Tax=Calocera cornea HHB12733 TaxID=1353952 RepID=A0A165HU69_9BASI|nr:hypothetical protein CALCODRAFT_493252 [Calocera cornea HHB12733]
MRFHLALATLTAVFVFALAAAVPTEHPDGLCGGMPCPGKRAVDHTDGLCGGMPCPGKVSPDLDCSA